MKPTEILSAEHRVIEAVLAALENFAAAAIRKKTLEAGPANEFVEFFRLFADKRHHGKEEAELFPRMEARGIPRDGGPIGVMLREHVMGRELVSRMAEAVKSHPGANGAAVRDFADSAEAFVLLLRAHIQKEDHCLFPMADQAMNQNDQRHLSQVFDQIDKTLMNEARQSALAAWAQTTAEAWDVPVDGINFYLSPAPARAPVK